MSRLLSRSEWGARAPRSTSGNIAAEGVTVHYGGPSPWPDSVDRSSPGAFRETADHGRCASIVRAWQSFHLDGRGWADLAYSSCCCPHGVRYDGRGPGTRTAAQGTTAGNDRSYAVCYIAGQDDPLTEAAKAAFLAEADRLDVPLRWGHRDWKSTGCPGDPLWAWRQAGFPGGDGSTTTPPGGDDDMTPEERETLNDIHRILTTEAVGYGQTDFSGTVTRGHRFLIDLTRRLDTVPTKESFEMRVISAVQWVLDDRGLTGDGDGLGGNLEEIGEFVADATREAIRTELPAVLEELDVALPGDIEKTINEGLARRILNKGDG